MTANPIATALPHTKQMHLDSADVRRPVTQFEIALTAVAIRGRTKERVGVFTTVAATFGRYRNAAENLPKTSGATD
jgi:hypothetical protein